MVNRRYEAQWMGKGKDILLVRFCCNTDLFPSGRRSKPRRECKYVPRIQGGYPSQLQRAKSGGTAYDYYHVGWRFCHCGNCGTAV